MKTVKRNILLNPGPATTTDSVKLAQVVPDICPREASFGRLMESVSEDLTALAGDPSYYTTVLFSGSGTAAVESILSSVIDQEAVVIINNGAYGKRMCEIAQTYRLNVVEFASPYDEAIDLSALEALIQHSPITFHILPLSITRRRSVFSTIFSPSGIYADDIGST